MYYFLQQAFLHQSFLGQSFPSPLQCAPILVAAQNGHTEALHILGAAKAHDIMDGEDCPT